MPRYYFHVATKTNFLPDNEGVHVQDEAAAHEYALRLIFQAMLYDSEERDWREWRVDVVDERKTVVLNIEVKRNYPGSQ
jgi:hypothetical protein